MEDAIRLSYREHQNAARLYFDEAGRDCYDTYLQGNETQRLKNILYVMHNESLDTLLNQIDRQDVRYLESHELLNTRQNLIPLVVIMMNGVMGILIISAYIYIDKGEGVVKALAVTPMRRWQYLLSKITAVLLVSLVSSIVITVPVMGRQAQLSAVCADGFVFHFF